MADSTTVIKQKIRDILKKLNTLTKDTSDYIEEAGENKEALNLDDYIDIDKTFEDFYKNKEDLTQGLIDYWNESVLKLWEQLENPFDGDEDDESRGKYNPSKIHDAAYSFGDKNFSSNVIINGFVKEDEEIETSELDGKAQYVSPDPNFNAEFYAGNRTDEIEEVLQNEKNLDYTIGKTREKYDELSEKLRKYITRLIMPQYARRVEVEDLDRNFWVIGQNLSILNKVVLDTDNGPLKKMLGEITDLWENVYRLWQVLYYIANQVSDIQDDVNDVISQATKTKVKLSYLNTWGGGGVDTVSLFDRLYTDAEEKIAANPNGSNDLVFTPTETFSFQKGDAEFFNILPYIDKEIIEYESGKTGYVAYVQYNKTITQKRLDNFASDDEIDRHFITNESPGPAGEIIGIERDYGKKPARELLEATRAKNFVLVAPMPYGKNKILDELISTYDPILTGLQFYRDFIMTAMQLNSQTNFKNVINNGNGSNTWLRAGYLDILNFSSSRDWSSDNTIIPASIVNTHKYLKKIIYPKTNINLVKDGEPQYYTSFFSDCLTELSGNEGKNTITIGSLKNKLKETEVSTFKQVSTGADYLTAISGKGDTYRNLIEDFFNVYAVCVFYLKSLIDTVDYKITSTDGTIQNGVYKWLSSQYSDAASAPTDLQTSIELSTSKANYGISSENYVRFSNLWIEVDKSGKLLPSPLSTVLTQYYSPNYFEKDTAETVNKTLDRNNVYHELIKLYGNKFNELYSLDGNGSFSFIPTYLLFVNTGLLSGGTKNFILTKDDGTTVPYTFKIDTSSLTDEQKNVKSGKIYWDLLSNVIPNDNFFNKSQFEETEYDNSLGCYKRTHTSIIYEAFYGDKDAAKANREARVPTPVYAGGWWLKDVANICGSSYLWACNFQKGIWFEFVRDPVHKGNNLLDANIVSATMNESGMRAAFESSSGPISVLGYVWSAHHIYNIDISIPFTDVAKQPYWNFVRLGKPYPNISNLIKQRGSGTKYISIINGAEVDAYDYNPAYLEVLNNENNFITYNNIIEISDSDTTKGVLGDSDGIYFCVDGFYGWDSFSGYPFAATESSFATIPVGTFTTSAATVSDTVDGKYTITIEQWRQRKDESGNNLYYFGNAFFDNVVYEIASNDLINAYLKTSGSGYGDRWINLKDDESKASELIGEVKEGYTQIDNRNEVNNPVVNISYLNGETDTQQLEILISKDETKRQWLKELIYKFTGVVDIVKVGDVLPTGLKASDFTKTSEDTTTTMNESTYGIGSYYIKSNTNIYKTLEKQLNNCISNGIARQLVFYDYNEVKQNKNELTQYYYPEKTGEEGNNILSASKLDELSKAYLKELYSNKLENNAKRAVITKIGVSFWLGKDGSQWDAGQVCGLYLLNKQKAAGSDEYQIEIDKVADLNFLDGYWDTNAFTSSGTTLYGNANKTRWRHLNLTTEKMKLVYNQSGTRKSWEANGEIFWQDRNQCGNSSINSAVGSSTVREMATKCGYNGKEERVVGYTSYTISDNIFTISNTQYVRYIGQDNFETINENKIVPPLNYLTNTKYQTTWTASDGAKNEWIKKAGQTPTTVSDSITALDTPILGIDFAYTGLNSLNYDTIFETDNKFVILKAGEANSIDSNFSASYQGCIDKLLPCGVYWDLSTDTNVDTIKTLLSGKTFEYPIYISFTLEDSDEKIKENKTLLGKVSEVCLALKVAGYLVGLKASPYDLNMIKNEEKSYNADYGSLLTSYEIWATYYNESSNSDYEGTYENNPGLWQYQSPTTNANVTKGKDKCYADYPTYVKKNNLNGFSTGGA